MRYWTRTTHNFNNETREWEYRNELPTPNVNLIGLGVHALENGIWMSEREIFSEYDKYYNTEETFDSRPTNDEILMSLEEMERLGMVRFKSI